MSKGNQTFAVQTLGCTGALHLSARLLKDLGFTTVLWSDPGYGKHHSAFEE